MVYYLITVTSPQGWLTLGLVQDILSKSLQKSVNKEIFKHYIPYHHSPGNMSSDSLNVLILVVAPTNLGYSLL